MKRSILAALLLSALTASAQPGGGRQTPREGSFTFSKETTLVADKELRPVADYAAQYLGYPVEQELSGDGCITLVLDAKGEIPAEGYRLEIDPDHITVRSCDYGGAFNGVQALFRLLPPEVYAKKGVPAGTELACAEIEDAPRFAFRGMMLDVARTWIDTEEVKRYIDLLAYHNINKFHIHLTDDEGWRIEIKSHPELAEIGGFRGGDSPVKALYGKWNEKYGGYYTQDEMREIIRYAAVRNIEVIPEIDLPGHSRTAGAVHPEIRCNYAPDTVATAGYDYCNAWCVAREENYALLEDILGEICALFPSEYIHIGGDEVNMTQWQTCPDCQSLMRQKGMTDPHQLEDLFLERVSDMLRRHGKRPAVWNEAVRTGAFSRDSRVHAWESTKACLDATAKGYQTIVMPGEYFYFDMRQSQHETGHTWAGVFDTEKVYSFDFEKAGFSGEQMSHVIGLQGAFWSEIYIANHPERPDYLDAMLFPRLCAVARLAWSGNEEGWETYYKELREQHYPRMTAMGIRYRLFPPRVTYAEGQLTATTDDGAEIRYVRDDRPEKEERYTGPVKTDRPQLYRFYSVLGTGRSPYAADASYYRMIRPAVKLTSSLPEDKKLPFSNVDTYKGYAYTTRTGRNGDWVLYTFTEPVTCREMLLRTGYSHLPKMQFLTGYAEVSYDGRTFERAGDLDTGAITLHPERPVKAVRLVCTSDGNGTPMVVIMPPEIKPAL